MEENFFKEIDGFDKFVKKASPSMFCGKYLSDMTKEELLGVIGWMQTDQENTAKQIKKDHQFLESILDSKYKENHLQKHSLLYVSITLIIVSLLLLTQVLN